MHRCSELRVTVGASGLTSRETPHLHVSIQSSLSQKDKGNTKRPGHTKTNLRILFANDAYCCDMKGFRGYSDALVDAARLLQ